jgi:hypothetical protein
MADHLQYTDDGTIGDERELQQIHSLLRKKWGLNLTFEAFHEMVYEAARLMLASATRDIFDVAERLDLNRRISGKMLRRRVQRMELHEDVAKLIGAQQ